MTATTSAIIVSQINVLATDKATSTTTIAPTITASIRSMTQRYDRRLKMQLAGPVPAGNNAEKSAITWCLSMPKRP
jgi:hypothetical protein